MKDNVLSWCRTGKLFLPGDRVACALSGGADSVAMLCCLASLQAELGITVLAAHFNHGLRGAESDRDEAFCEALCRQRGIGFFSGRGDVAERCRKTGESIEQAARALRYEFLLSVPCDKLATAHTADDNLETILMNLTRGTGLRGLGGIPPVRGKIVRPMLCVTRPEIEQYLLENGLAHVEDSTNGADGCLRNRLRHRVIPLLRQENPALGEQSVLLAARLRADEDYLSAQAAALLAGAEDSGGWELSRLLCAPEPLLARVAAQILSRAGLTRPTAGHVRAVLNLLRSASPSARCSLPGGWLLRRRYGSVLLERDAAPPVWEPVALPAPGEAALPAAGLRIVCSGPQKILKPCQSSNKFAVRCAMIEGAFWLRPRRAGDALRLPGGSKRLSRLQIDRKIPADLRNLLPVFETGGRVAAAAGIGADVRFLAAAGETGYLIEIFTDREEGFHDRPE